jgi:monothiol glutaredoxin
MNENNIIDVSENIKNEIKSSDVVLFMKGTPVFPMCGFSAATVQILSDIGVKFSSVNVLDSDEMREGIKKFSNWPTIPQLYIKEEFVGGCDIVKEMNESGELIELLSSRGIDVKPS